MRQRRSTRPAGLLVAILLGAWLLWGQTTPQPAPVAAPPSPAASTATAGDYRVSGVSVVDINTGRRIDLGTVDLKPTLDRIAAGERHSHRNDGSVFRNAGGLLPRRPSGYYREYVVPTPGVRGPGPQRLVLGQGGEIYYTADHYDSFIRIDGGG